VHTWGINGGPLGAGEWVQMSINGSVYPLTPADITSYTECSPGGGPMYLNAGRFMGPIGTAGNYNGGDYVISVCTGITSFELYCNGSLSGVAYHIEMDTVRPPSCVQAINNSPCIGDTLKLDMVGDSTGATYAWTGPGGFTSSLQNPFKFPSTFADSGWYVCIRNAGVVNDTDSTYVIIHPKPVVNATNNSPLCAGAVSTLLLDVSPDSTGETYIWSGPLGFASFLRNPSITTFTSADTGIYYVYATTRFGCKDTGQTHVTVIPRPATPIVTDMNYCQGEPFVPYTLGLIDPADTVFWYNVGVGGVGSTTPMSVNTLVPGLYHVWVSQKRGACESLRGTDSVRVTTTPPAPAVVGTMQYCQFIGPVTPLTVTTTTSGVAHWYTTATGGSFTLTQPLANINVAGTYNWWVSQIDSGCEGPRTPVVVTVHPKPAPPIINPTPICQYRTPGPVSATPSGTGDFLLWYGPGVTVGTTVAPTPSTLVAPDTINYFVTETTIYGCVSDSSLDRQVIKVKPPVPNTRDIAYCQHGTASYLNQLVDSIGDSHLNWYYNTVSLNPTPKPFTDTVPGIYTWYVSQTVPNNATGCESDSAAVNVTIIYKPSFHITSESPFVCQYDSIRLSYCCGSQALYAPGYHWILPAGASTVGGTGIFDSTVIIKFDTANQLNYVHLIASNDSGFCSTDTSIYINVVKQPDMSSFTQPDVCLGDTVQLGLSSIAAGAAVFTWSIDNVPMASSPAIKMIASNSHSGGPFSISWVDSGMHVVRVSSVTSEGCASKPAYDSVNVRSKPDASFKIVAIDSSGSFCLEDSVLFAANTNNRTYKYEWAPEHAFNNINAYQIYGKIENAHTVITLKVTDPFGCTSTSNMLFDQSAGTLGANSCCTVLFPNAFTPNGDGRNNVFRPIFSGYHRFHVFRIVNRWGITMFEGGNSNVQWDGTYNGIPQDMGTYFYYLKYDCGGKTREIKGDVTLIR
jgi:gliding motility-associated-like protein